LLTRSVKVEFDLLLLLLSLDTFFYYYWPYIFVYCLQTWRLGLLGQSMGSEG